MGKIDMFKEFVKQNPKLITHVKTGDMTWQKFYELYDLYGEDGGIWKDYLTTNIASIPTNSTIGLNEVVSWLRKINLDGIQNGVENVQRVVSVLQDFTNKNEKSTSKEEYKPRPLYKSFED